MKKILLFLTISMLSVQVSYVRGYQEDLDAELLFDENYVPVPEQEMQEADVRALRDEDVDYKEKMGPWPIDIPARALPAPYCGKCKKRNGKVRRSWGVWPLDLPLRVLPTKYCGPCEQD